MSIQYVSFQIFINDNPRQQNQPGAAPVAPLQDDQLLLPSLLPAGAHVHSEGHRGEGHVHHYV